MKAILETIRVLECGLFWLLALPVAALIEIGLVLFAITLIVNSLSRILIWSMARPAKRVAPVAVVVPEESAA